MTNFCEGKLSEFERMMKEIPNFDKRIIPKKERDCEKCKLWDGKKCSVPKCPYFD